MARKAACGLVLALGFLVAGGALPCLAEEAKTAEAAPSAAILRDWVLQDHGKDPSPVFAGSADAATEIGIVGRVLKDLGPAAKPFRETLDQLTKEGVPGSDKRWTDLYAAACRERRKARLQQVTRKYPKIVFTKHYNLGGSHYAYTEGQSDAQAERHFQPGAALCLLELDASGATVRTLIDDPKGVIRDPDVSYDGKRILFAWKKSDREDDYHLYELNTETGEVRQLTFGLGFADYEPAYLPSGDILLNSTRCVQIVDCWWTEVSNLYACDKDGKYMRRLTFDQVHTNYPQVLEDGRVIYTRWDYNDRGQLFPQPLFQMNVDGTGQTEFYGNNSWFPTTIMHARGIPGTQKVVGIISGHHCIQKGKLGIVDPSRGTQEATGVQLVAPVRETKAERIDSYGQDGDQFQYPYPVTETEFVVAFAPEVGGAKRGHGPFGIYLMDIDGRRELLACDPKISCNQPVPLASRPLPPRRPSGVDYRKDTGVYYVKDVYVGPGLKSIERGTVKSLRVVALEFRAAGIGANGSGGPAGGALSSTPPSVRNATWDVKRVLGTTPVYADGSAMFTVPARMPVYFQLLDEKNRVVQSMRSWSTLQPGETFSCVGCHEGKNETSPPEGGITTAVRQGPRALEPFYGPTRGFSFPKEIQPILDKHCTRCHDDRSAAPKETVKSAYKEGPLRKDLRPIFPLEDQWQYTTADPGAGWQKPAFDTSQWKTGMAGFGTKGTPGGNVCTEWRTGEIWLRKTFVLPADWTAEAGEVVLRHCHDEDVMVYINGIRVFDGAGFITKFRDETLSTKALKPGPNVIAVNCRQTGGGQFIDVALLTAPTKTAVTPVVVAEAPPPPPLPPGVKKSFSLLDTRRLDGESKRMWSDSYLVLTRNGSPNKIVNWLNVQSIPPMLPPYFAGAAKSELIAMLEKGHYEAKLNREEMDKIACWIDLLVPFCGDYTEANAWDENEKKKYAHFLAKRERMAAIERENIEAMLAPKATQAVEARPAEDTSAYRNVALNPKDVQGPPAGYPHATASSEFGSSPCFAAKCAIDGKTANKGHGDAFPSWGPDRRKDLWWKVEFGRAAEIDKVVLYIRADFPHDGYWHDATIEFSDGTREKVKIQKTAEPQTFTFKARTATWLKFAELVQDEPLGWCGFTEVEVWGREAKAVTRVAALAGGRE